MKYTWDYTWDFEDDVPLDPALYVSPIELMLLNGDSRDCRIGVGENPYLANLTEGWLILS